MKINNLKIEGTYLIELNPIIDSRGYFVRTYEKQLFKANNLATKKPTNIIIILSIKAVVPALVKNETIYPILLSK